MPARTLDEVARILRGIQAAGDSRFIEGTQTREPGLPLARGLLDEPGRALLRPEQGEEESAWFSPQQARPRGGHPPAHRHPQPGLKAFVWTKSADQIFESPAGFVRRSPIQDTSDEQNEGIRPRRPSAAGVPISENDP